MMGMYTGLKLELHLKDNTPDIILEILKYLCNEENTLGEEIKPEHLPNHPFFTASKRWWFMLRSSSFYLEHDYPPESNLIGRKLNISCNLKNYDNEIQYFLDWISPYVDKFVDGSYGYEEDEVHSDIIFLNNQLIIK